MKKEDLRSGDIIEYNDDKFGLVVKTELGLLIQIDRTWASVELLCFKDVKSVRRITDSRNHVIRHNLSKAPIIWERKKEIPEYTMEQLQEKLGEEFKIKK